MSSPRSPSPKTRSPINVAIVGLQSPELAWTEVDALMQQRTRIVAIWDAVTAKSALVEREAARRDDARLRSQPRFYRSLTKLAEHTQLDAAIVLDPGWTGLWSARRLADEGLPVLWLANWPPQSAWAFSGVGRDLIVPGLTLRYCPATVRLRELVATKLGPVDEIDGFIGSDTSGWEMADWAATVAGSRVVAQEQTVDDAETMDAETMDAETMNVELTHHSGVVSRLRQASGDAASRAEEKTRAIIRCEQGQAEWSPPDTLRWSTEHSSEQTVGTQGDRNGIVVMLDLFFRRVIGGLVPVPSVDDVTQAIGFDTNV